MARRAGSATTNKPAKTSRPAARSALPRPRLFRLLDRARSRPLTWVWGPPGAGKTTLVTSYLTARRLRGLWYHVDEGDTDLASFFYFLREAAPKRAPALPLLTPEYLPGLPVFALRFFRQVFARLPRPFALVLDNFQTVGLESRLHEILAIAAENVPPGGRLIVISRLAPSAAFARLRTNQALSMIDYGDLKLVDREARALVKRLGHGRVAATTSKRLVETANGWAGGLVLLTAHVSHDMHVAPTARAERPPQAVFDYFASQVIATLDPEAQQVLMKVAFLPWSTAGMAVSLTGVARAGDVLSDLARRGYFTNVRTDAEIVFQYHDLFREFLQARAHGEMVPAERAGVQRRAANLLADAGQLAAAAGLYRDAEDWESLARLIITRAAELLGQGRGQTIEEWLASLPPSSVAETPWLLYWRGMCRMPSDPRLAREDFERALPLFRACGDASGTFLAWSAAADTYPHEAADLRPLDRWIPLLDELRHEFPRFPSRPVEDQVVTSMFVALTWRQPQHPEMATWTQRAFEVARTTRVLPLRMQAELFLVIHHYWMGRMSTARQALDTLQATTATKDAPELLTMLALTATSAYQLLAGELRECQETVAAAVEQADATGIQVWTAHLLGFAASAALSSGDTKTAGRSMKRMAESTGGRLFDVSYYQHLRGWRALIEGDVALAASSQEAAVASAVELGIPFAEAMWRNLLAQVRRAEGKTAAAAAEVARSLDLARTMGNHLLEWAGGLVEAQLALDQGDQTRGLATLAHALAIGREHGLVNIWTWNPAAFTELYAVAHAHGIEPDYVRWVIRKRGLRPDRASHHLDQWPSPLQIMTLGRFEILRDGEPLGREGKKTQRRLLTLLKALIAFGGDHVDQARLADAVWPDADGDAAQRSLAIAVHRLRRLLGDNKALRRQGGRLSLDREDCWVDVWALEHLLTRAEKSSDLGELTSLGTRLGALYGGRFLVDDPQAAWATPLADRLERRILRFLATLAAHHEDAREWDRVADYQRCRLAIAPTLEDATRRLMTALHHLGQRGDLVDAYERYRDALVAAGTSPSLETNALYRRLAGEGPR